MNQQLHEQVSLSRAILLYIIVSLFLFFEMGVQVSPSVMAPQLMHDLNIGALGLGVMSGFYFYTYAAMQIPSGLLFDKFNPRWIITLSILGCALGAAVFSFAQNIYMGIIARLLMGTGSAFAFVSVLVVTADLFRPKYFALMTGITQMLAALGAMSGQLPLSALVQSIGWRYSLLVLAGIGLVLSIIVWKLLTYERHRQPAKPHNHELSIGQSLKKILTNPQTWFIGLYACLLWAPMSGFASLWGVSFLASFDHLSQNTAALVCSFMWIGLAAASPFLGWFSTFLGRRKLPLTISAALGTVAFAMTLQFHLPAWALASLLFIAGAACSGQALSFSVIKENNSRLQQATAIAVNNMAVVISGAVFQPVIGRLLQAKNKMAGTQAHLYSSHDFQVALLTVLGAYLIGALVAGFFIRETYCQDAVVVAK